jgi:hypothetical protein
MRLARNLGMSVYIMLIFCTFDEGGIFRMKLNEVTV